MKTVETKVLLVRNFEDLTAFFFLFAMRMNEYMFTGWCGYWYSFSFFLHCTEAKSPINHVKH